MMHGQTNIKLHDTCSVPGIFAEQKFLSLCAKLRVLLTCTVRGRPEIRVYCDWTGELVTRFIWNL